MRTDLWKQKVCNIEKQILFSVIVSMTMNDLNVSLLSQADFPNYRSTFDLQDALPTTQSEKLEALSSMLFDSVV